MPPKKKLVPNETFFLTFIGERVVLASKIKLSEVVQKEDEVSSSEVPIMFEGFLLDMDEHYYYLGTTPEAISDAIVREDIFHISIDQPVNPLREALRNVEIKGEIN